MRAIVVAILALGTSLLLSAQDAAPEFLLNREQVAALVKAFNEGLAYVPGEVLVKFRPGFEPAEQARALSVVRGGLGIDVYRHAPDGRDSATIRRHPKTPRSEKVVRLGARSVAQTGS